MKPMPNFHLTSFMINYTNERYKRVSYSHYCAYRGFIKFIINCVSNVLVFNEKNISDRSIIQVSTLKDRMMDIEDNMFDMDIDFHKLWFHFHRKDKREIFHLKE